LFGASFDVSKHIRRCVFMQPEFAAGLAGKFLAISVDLPPNTLDLQGFAAENPTYCT